MANIIVAVICNVIAVFVLLGCVLSTLRSGIAVSGLRLILTVGGGVAAFFLTPIISTAIVGIAVEETTLGAVISNLGISLGTVKSIIFLAVFMVVFLINLIICAIVKHCRINALRNKKQNVAKIKRAKSINPRAEKAARKSAWKALKAEYKARNTWWKRLINGIFGAIVGVVLGFVVLMPYGYIAKDVVNANADREYLTAGYEYTLNGVIGSEVSDWILHENQIVEEIPEEPAEEVPVE